MKPAPWIVAGLALALALALGGCAGPGGTSRYKVARTWGQDGKPLTCEAEVILAREADSAEGASELCGDKVGGRGTAVRGFEGQRIAADARREAIAELRAATADGARTVAGVLLPMLQARDVDVPAPAAAVPPPPPVNYSPDPDDAGRDN